MAGKRIRRPTWPRTAPGALRRAAEALASEAKQHTPKRIFEKPDGIYGTERRFDDAVERRVPDTDKIESMLREAWARRVPPWRCEAELNSLATAIRVTLVGVLDLAPRVRAAAEADAKRQNKQRKKDGAPKPTGTRRVGQDQIWVVAAITTLLRSIDPNPMWEGSPSAKFLMALSALVGHGSARASAAALANMRQRAPWPGFPAVADTVDEARQARIEFQKARIKGILKFRAWARTLMRAGKSSSYPRSKNAGAIRAHVPSDLVRLLWRGGQARYPFDKRF